MEPSLGIEIGVGSSATCLEHVLSLARAGQPQKSAKGSKAVSQPTPFAERGRGLVTLQLKSYCGRMQLSTII